MKAVFVSGDQTGKYALSVSDDGRVILYSNTAQGMKNMETFDIDSKEAQFLPYSLGLSFISGDKKGNLTVYHNDGLKFNKYEIENFHDFSRNLRVSTYPPQPYVAYITDKGIVVFEIVFNEKVELLPVRNYVSADNFVSFDFGPNNTIWAVSKSATISKLNINSNKPTFVKASGEPIYIAPSPLADNICAVLFKENKVSIITDDNFKDISHTTKNAEIIQWSPLGTSFIVYGDEKQVFKQSSPNVWRESK